MVDQKSTDVSIYFMYLQKKWDNEEMNEVVCRNSNIILIVVIFYSFLKFKQII